MEGSPITHVLIKNSIFDDCAYAGTNVIGNNTAAITEPNNTGESFYGKLEICNNTFKLHSGQNLLRLNKFREITVCGNVICGTDDNDSLYTVSEALSFKRD